MHLDLDTGIFLSFLAVNLAVGLFYGKNIRTIREYAIGDQNFSTGTIAATLIATWIGGSYFSVTLSKTYSEGLYFLIPGFGDVLAFLIIGFVFAPRMAEFLGKLSVAEAMGDLFGVKAQVITAIAGCIRAVGIIAVQFKVASTVLNYFFNTGTLEVLLISGAIITLYSAFGGIKAVTFTDIIQFFTFGVFIPILALVIWGALDNPDAVTSTITNNPIFDYKEVLNYNNPKFFYSFSLLIYFCIPELNPPIFQRIIMAKSTEQVAKSFIIAALICFFIEAITSWVGVLLLSQNPGLDPKDLVSYIINNYAYSGMKGFIMVGIMAMIMSTADSFINSSAVLFGNDFCKPLGIKWDKNNLIPYRIFAIIIGLLSVLLAIYTKGMLEIVLMTASFYTPIVVIPLILAILGFRSTFKSFLIGMCASLVTVLYWRNYMMDTGVDSIMPGMVTSLIFFMGSHYLLKQPGGWVGIKDDRALVAARDERAKIFRNLLSSVANFNFLTFCRNNSPSSEVTYSYFGLFSIVSVFSTMYSLPQDVRTSYAAILEIIYHSVLISSTIFLSYPIWPPTFKKEAFVNIFWVAGVFYIPVFVGSLLVIISNFGQFQSMIFMVNLIMTAIMLRWQVAVFMMFSGVIAAIQFFKFYTGTYELPGASFGLQFKIMYALLMVTSVLIAFLKPKQRNYEVEGLLKNEFERKARSRTVELVKALEVKKDILKNVSHEIRSPIHAVSNILDILDKHWELYNDSQKREYISIGATTSRSLSTLISSILDYSKLSSNKVKLKIEKVNFIDVIHDVINECKTLYLNGKEIAFTINSSIKTEEFLVDKELFKQIMRNLIMNAIQYSNSGIISVSIKSKMQKLDIAKENGSKDKLHFACVEFKVSDEGVGIPEEELQEIFGSFVQSTRTKTMAGGRGIGLALVKKTVEAHLGDIWAENNEGTGATFTVRLPMDLEVLRKMIDFKEDEQSPAEDEMLAGFLDNSIKARETEIARKLLTEDVSAEIVTKVTGLTKADLEKIDVQQSLNKEPEFI